MTVLTTIIHMFFIAHRGNLNGPNPAEENKPDYIADTMKSGYDCEIDVWVVDNMVYLGHDAPQYVISLDWLQLHSSKLWCHAKNLAAFEFLLDHDLRCFGHDNDHYVLTSTLDIWAFPGQPLTSNTICVMPERVAYTNAELSKCKAICTDLVIPYKKKLA